MPMARAASDRYVFVAGAFSALALACFLAGFLMAPLLGVGKPGVTLDDAVLPEPVALQPFLLDDHNGAPFTRDRLLGRWTMLTFGYSHCPDHCKRALAALERVAQRTFDDDWPGTPLQVLFVTVDSRRDTPATLARFLAEYHPSFLGLRGSDRATAALARQLGVIFLREFPDEHGIYLVQHTHIVLLIDPQARLVAGFGLPYDSEHMLDRLAALVASSKEPSP